VADDGMIVRIREIILDGTLPPGARVTEEGLAERLRVSRTPVRSALPALAREGLLERVGKRGYAVRGFTLNESLDALEVRGALEGLAARKLAGGGVSEGLADALKVCLAEGDILFAKGYLAAADETAYGGMNARFHALIVEGAGSPLLGDLYSRVNQVPRASAGAVAFDRLDLTGTYRRLSYAHGQHHAIVEAIAEGDGARAEALLREHTRPERQGLR